MLDVLSCVLKLLLPLPIVILNPLGMLQQAGQHLKHRPKTKEVTPLLFELSAINGGVSIEKEI